MLKTPILIVNFKTYSHSTGENALKLAKICDEIAKKTGKSIAVAVLPEDINTISKQISIPVLAQHVDGIEYGSHTGHVLPESIKNHGAVGSLLNHSEDQYRFRDLKKATMRMKETGMISVICAASPRMSKKVAMLNPEFVAVELSELIGGDVSVSTAKPKIISKTVKIVKRKSPNTVVLCGAGVNSFDDVKKALELGAQGVLVASAIVKSENPKKVIEEMVGAF
ncbi:triose-phosphate isomerase [Candidatus Woesearchaeota archaeon]|nr:triose-phosphate isomerase [Candidatus Woesearchaeota archaeon]